MEYIKKVIKQFANSIPDQTKVNADAKCNFDTDTKGLIETLAKIGVHLRDENNNYRSLCDVLKDIGEKYEQISSTAMRKL